MILFWFDFLLLHFFSSDFFIVQINSNTFWPSSIFQRRLPFLGQESLVAKMKCWFKFQLGTFFIAHSSFPFTKSINSYAINFSRLSMLLKFVYFLFSNFKRLPLDGAHFIQHITIDIVISTFIQPFWRSLLGPFIIRAWISVKLSSSHFSSALAVRKSILSDYTVEHFIEKYNFFPKFPIWFKWFVSKFAVFYLLIINWKWCVVSIVRLFTHSLRNVTERPNCYCTVNEE